MDTPAADPALKSGQTLMRQLKDQATARLFAENVALAASLRDTLGELSATDQPPDLLRAVAVHLGECMAHAIAEGLVTEQQVRDMIAEQQQRAFPVPAEGPAPTTV